MRRAILILLVFGACLFGENLYFQPPPDGQNLTIQSLTNTPKAFPNLAGLKVIKTSQVASGQDMQIPGESIFIFDDRGRPVWWQRNKFDTLTKRLMKDSCTEWDYDGERLIRKTDSLFVGEVLSGERMVSFVYMDSGRVTTFLSWRTIDGAPQPDSFRNTLAYDESDRIVELQKVQYLSWLSPITTRTTYTYDAENLPLGSLTQRQIQAEWKDQTRETWTMTFDTTVTCSSTQTYTVRLSQKRVTQIWSVGDSLWVNNLLADWTLDAAGHNRNVGLFQWTGLAWQSMTPIGGLSQPPPYLYFYDQQWQELGFTRAIPPLVEWDSLGRIKSMGDYGSRTLFAYSPAVAVENASVMPAEETLSVSPNPFNPELRIRFSVNAPKRISLEIFNVSGKSVRLLFTGQKSAGFSTLSWDGRDDAGRQLASGIYLVRLSNANCALTRKVQLMR